MTASASKGRPDKFGGALRMASPAGRSTVALTQREGAMSNSISYAHGTTLSALMGETIGSNFDRVASSYPERDALVVPHQDVRWSYGELAARVDQLARGLVAIGLRPGDRMGIWAPNCAEWVLAQYASAKAGVILVNINPAYRTSELEYVLNRSGCRLLMSARAYKTSDYAGMVEEVSPRCRDLERTVFLDSGDWEEMLATGDSELSLPAGLQLDRKSVV